MNTFVRKFSVIKLALITVLFATPITFAQYGDPGPPPAPDTPRVGGPGEIVEEDPAFAPDTVLDAPDPSLSQDSVISDPESFDMDPGPGGITEGGEEVGLPPGGVVDEPESVVEQPDPLVDEPLVRESEGVVEANEPLVNQPDPLVRQPAALVEQPDPLVDEPDPLVQQPPALVEQPEPLVEQPDPLVPRGEAIGGGAHGGANR